MHLDFKCHIFLCYFFRSLLLQVSISRASFFRLWDYQIFGFPIDVKIEFKIKMIFIFFFNQVYMFLYACGRRTCKLSKWHLHIHIVSCGFLCLCVLLLIANIEERNKRGYSWNYYFCHCCFCFMSSYGICNDKRRHYWGMRFG